MQQPGRDQAIFVVGKSQDEKIATKTAGDINELFRKSDSGKELRAIVIKAPSSDNFYVAVGDITSPAKAGMFEKAAKDTALKTLVGSSDQKEKETAKILSGGDVVRSESLFKK